VLILSHDDVLATLTPEACIEVMADVLAAHARGEAYMPLRSVMAVSAASGFMGLMPAWRAADGDRLEDTFGLKAICIMPGNPAKQLDAHQGVVVLFDGAVGAPTAVLDASAVTEIRTAAVTALATRTLAREDSSVLAIIGAGVQGHAHLISMPLARDFREVRIFSRTPERARALAQDVSKRSVPPRGQVHAGSPEIVVADSARAAVSGADVVVTATSSRTPVIQRAWLGAGTHINAIGASQPSATELDVETVAASAMFCDSRESIRNEAGEFRQALEQGAISGEEHIRAELGEVLAGMAEGRRDDGELTLFRSLGIGVEDLAAAQFAVQTARELGIGAEVEM
jgi:ornithine cyclodeaminase